MCFQRDSKIFQLRKIYIHNYDVNYLIKPRYSDQTYFRCNLFLLKHLRDDQKRDQSKTSRKAIDDSAKSIESECSFPKVGLGIEGIKELTRTDFSGRRRCRKKAHKVKFCFLLLMYRHNFLLPLR